VLASVRPDELNLPLFLHVLGAMLLVGVLLMAVVGLAAARAGVPGSARFGFRSLLIAGIPSYLMMRIGAQWIADKEKLADSDATWITLGYAVAEGGLLLMVIALVCSGIASRRAGRGEQAGGLATAATWLCAVLLVAYVVALWAMSAKPS
jgi:hypothetical protein